MKIRNLFINYKIKYNRKTDKIHQRIQWFPKYYPFHIEQGSPQRHLKSKKLVFFLFKLLIKFHILQINNYSTNLS